MAMKRYRSPELVQNPFIKKRNLEWSIDTSGSPHDTEEGTESDEPQDEGPASKDDPRAPAIEAGEIKINDHLNYFSDRLSKAVLSPFPQDMPRLLIGDYRKLYETNYGNPRGSHFIIHQHDHPIAGTHYDLRLQINETSSASWAIMYGLPGDPNSQRLNRNATETRIHCLWNHLIETASNSTGSLLIWDTGTYSILPNRENRKAGADLNSQSEEEEEEPELTEQEKLHNAFQRRKIRIRLDGTRLPDNYVLNLRLTKDEDAAGRAKSGRVPVRRRKRGNNSAPKPKRGENVEPVVSSTSDEDSETVNVPAETIEQSKISAMEREIRELEDEQVRHTNAYVGASNTIGSVHKRRWYLSLDREACGFAKSRVGGRSMWERVKRAFDEAKDEIEDEVASGKNRLTFPFYVRGVDVERSVVTGRTGAEVLSDEGVVGYVGRKGWRPVLK
ncbi:DNA polymerase ligase-domain-containing protein [Hypoxylon trugodes]|uniref:DNA polymerase ligase-domain-containing protein n=1 Tax=Hypoxylon trugodes TaxID=326681 RepID=UPI00218E3EC8|nr:DNA polymerase ligase-domain-containing protein [Hypoxylon trugodes]KAI1384113.1 DNA polymerase ligase-domain-containing protein [Hypoxylon trugodes]